MKKQIKRGRRLAAEAKKQGALSAELCWHGTALAVHIQEPSGSVRSEVVYPCGCVDTEVHRPAEASAAILPAINQHAHTKGKS